MDVVEFLLDWAKQYFISRDAYNKKIKNIKQEKGSLIIKYVNHSDKLIGLSTLDSARDMELSEINYIVLLNNRKNIDSLYKDWDIYSKYEKLKIYFINPYSTTDRKWIICPFVHNRICDSASLKLGLNSMFESVQPLTEEILVNKMAVQS